MKPTAYITLKGNTRNQRQQEVPQGYRYQLSEDGKTEVWYDPHGMKCVLCDAECADTLPNPNPSFMCVSCGFIFTVDFCDNQYILNKKVVLNYNRNSKPIIDHSKCDFLD